MVSIFLVFVAVVAFFWGVSAFYATEATAGILRAGDLVVPLLLWTVSALCFASAAVLDSINTAAKKMIAKLEELAGKPN